MNMRTLVALGVVMLMWQNSVRADGEAGQVKQVAYRFQTWRESVWLPFKVNFLAIEPRQAEDRYYYF